NTLAWLIVNTGSRNCKLTLLEASGKVLQRWIREGDDSPGQITAWLADVKVPVAFTVHRLVNGGDKLTAPGWWSPALDAALAPLDALAPLHNPAARRWAAACAQRWPGAQHCLIPDNGFFHDLPDIARTLPLPAPLCRRFGLHHYGFHGLAHAGLWRQLADCDRVAARGRVVTLQLGGGCSAAALRNGVPVDTSMSFSPLAGLVMATRPGNLDAGALLHLMRSGFGVDDLERLLYHESGLKGLSSLSGDMRDLLASPSMEAALAIDQFCYRISQYVGAYAASLGGLDAIVFGGGIGENASLIRERVMSSLAFLGVVPDGEANAVVTGNGRISHTASRVAVWVIQGDEETEMRRLALQLLEHGNKRR
ncbi:MAG TPA: hypothetical protein VFM34_08090, partial [Moraxellaceae bacterium]|nr:hypothetical protein [Moraxellaceae bacterium]